MGYWLHDRTYDHRGTEDCSTVVLSADIGRYTAGTSLCDVIDDLARRMSQIELDYIHGFFVLGLNAFVAPYDPGTLGGSLLGLFGLDAVVLTPMTPTFGLDAVLATPTPVEVDFTFGLDAYLNVVAADGVTVLAAAIDASQTTITMTSASGFPTSGNYTIQIGGETMLVTGGQGTTTWTVIRGYAGTTATSHTAGQTVVTC